MTYHILVSLYSLLSTQHFEVGLENHVHGGELGKIHGGEPRKIACKETPLFILSVEVARRDDWCKQRKEKNLAEASNLLVSGGISQNEGRGFSWWWNHPKQRWWWRRRPSWCVSNDFCFGLGDFLFFLFFVSSVDANVDSLLTDLGALNVIRLGHQSQCKGRQV
jgi:hypothetical protein